MYMRCRLFIFGLIVTSSIVKAQLFSIINFMSDTVIRAQVAANHVSTVKEIIKDSTTRNNGWYLFDSKGRVIETNTSQGIGYNRLKLAYNEKGQPTQQTRYDFSDTTKVESWKTYRYDNKGRLLALEGGQFYAGQKLEGKFFEINYVKDKKGKERTVSKSYSDYKPRSTSYGHDSISGIDTFYVSYEFNTRDEGRASGLKKLLHTRKKDGYVYEDEITYMVFGRTETPQQVKSSYFQLDKNKRMLEEGEMDFQETYMDFSQENPEDFNENYYSPKFIKAIIEGKIKGKKKNRNAFKYDEKGNLIERQEQGYTITMKYNENNLVTEMHGSGKFQEEEEEQDRAVTAYEQNEDNARFPETTVEIFYSGKNLPVKAVTTTRDTNQKSPAKITNELIYEYLYY